MAVKLNDVSVNVTCPHGHVNGVHIYDWAQEEPEIYETSESKMGPQTCHRFSLEGIQCSQCSSLINAQIEVWEYPPGIKEFTGTTSNVNAVDAESAINVEGE